MFTSEVMVIFQGLYGETLFLRRRMFENVAQAFDDIFDVILTNFCELTLSLQ
jgi:hypothetical protein